MSTRRIIDRRTSPSKKSLPNKQRFVKRVEDQIKKAIPDIVDATGIKDFAKGNGKVKIPIKGIKEPQFGYDNATGDKKFIHPGNKEFSEGDKIKKPDGGGKGKGKKGSKDENPSEDEFTISISKEEFLDYFFKDLELPDMIKKELQDMTEVKYKRSGYTNEGVPSRLNVINSYKQSIARRTTMKAFYDKKIKELEDQLENETDPTIIEELELKIVKYKNLALVVPYMNDIDLRYNNFEPNPVPTVSAVMFCIMDVSGSMGQKEKDIAKRFFILLYLFLTKNYEKIDIVYIRHTTISKEVEEKEFFESRESGGTMVAPSLKLMDDILDERYSKGWNVYACQISDGDVWDKKDADDCYRTLSSTILAKLQYMIYVEVLRDGKGDLFKNYTSLSKEKDNFIVAQINDVKDIWSVFSDLFKKNS
ncbi:MAG: putative sporulation protein YhbH [uncultured marine phage]|uniref:Putative sporulation protein YhbH n=1 Tax=uncultured marine phage TaxID=707152 RepID=A0A8D9CER2_9VIRU|nr:MAG: putative sporulation protein YhbH [uncultured marine phage]